MKTLCLVLMSAGWLQVTAQYFETATVNDALLKSTIREQLELSLLVQEAEIILAEQDSIRLRDLVSSWPGPLTGPPAPFLDTRLADVCLTRIDAETAVLTGTVSIINGYFQAQIDRLNPSLAMKDALVSVYLAADQLETVVVVSIVKVGGAG